MTGDAEAKRLQERAERIHGKNPFAKSSPKAKEMPVNDTGCTCYDAFDRARGVYFTQKCENHR